MILIPEDAFAELDRLHLVERPVPENAIFTDDVMKRYGVSRSRAYDIIRTAVKNGSYKEGFTNRRGKRERYIYTA